MIQLYNTLVRDTVPFQPLEPGKVGMYVCGPTVQSEPHIGHGRSAVAFDVIRRYLTWRGYQVTYVQNITDIDDKIIQRAQERQITAEQLAAQMTDCFRECYRALNVSEPDLEPRATQHIDDMIQLISRLIDRDLAYPAGGDVYFRVRSHPGYGKLSGRNPDDLRAGARVEPGEAKQDPLDFALWKAAKPQEPAWDSPWGPGRPGWHIECSAMSARYLGTPFDIHAGGVDLVFPHHENEIAQSEGAWGQEFARFWLHNGLVNLRGEKMSKSTGHIVDLAQAIIKMGGPVLRLFYLRASYRSPLEFSSEHLAEAAANLDRLRAFLRRSRKDSTPQPEWLDRFGAAMDDDFNTAQGLAVLFELVREGNARLDRGEEAGGLAATAQEIIAVLGIDLGSAELDDIAHELDLLAESHQVNGKGHNEKLEGLIAMRKQARDNQDWTAADQIRQGLAQLGIKLEDSADGTRWHRLQG